MMKINHILAIVFGLMLLSACTDRPTDATPVDRQPDIYPDYIGVTIPSQIAPMNFNVIGDNVDYVYVDITGSKGGNVVARGRCADIDVDDWRKLTAADIGGTLTFEVSVRGSRGRWNRYQPFEMYVSETPLNDYGVTYRKIAPGYETFSKIGIYQRELSTYDESPILEETAVNGQCLNCHISNRGSADQFTIHVRGAHGGTLISKDGKLDYLNTKTDHTKGNCTYGYWHPDGRYCVYSLNRIYQNFHVSNDKNIEPWDSFSDIVVLDTETNELITTPILEDDDYQTYPAFSPDGATIYFCYAPAANMPADYAKLRYSLCSVAFDARNGVLSDSITTVISADSIGRSVSLPRPSYDGRYLMYNLTDYGTSPVHRAESDLYLMDLATGQSRPMTEVNSEYSDGYHNWSSDGGWFLFSSKRDDGMYANLYFSLVGADGNATKPFMMPQRNPQEYYRNSLYSYNAPDFTRQRVALDAVRARNLVLSAAPTQVK